MAPFNQRQIGYIQAIAGRQQHRTLIAGNQNQKITSEGISHATYKPATIDTTLVSGGVSGTSSDGNNDDRAKSLLLHTWHLDNTELGFDSRSKHNNSKLESDDFNGLKNCEAGCGNVTSLEVFNAEVKGSHVLSASDNVNTNASADGQLLRNPERISSAVRATPDGFLNSTNVKFRFTLPGRHTPVSGTAPMGSDHYEFRWIVWRHKRPTMAHDADTTTNHTNLEAIRDGVSFRNPGYDFFMGQTGRKRGFLGYTMNEDLDKDKVQDVPNGEVYCGYRRSADGASLVNTDNLVDATIDGKNPKDGIPAYETKFTVDDVMTQRINRDDYVIMKDVRFFLGKEHGKSHFEDTLHWDWNDPIDTPDACVLGSPTLNNKNYRWHMTLMGTSGADSPCVLLSNIRWTTKMESG